MTREEAIKEIREWDFINKDDMEVLATLVPELRESEDERTRKLLVWQVYRNIEDETNDLAKSVYDGIKGHDPDLEESIEDWKKCLAWLEKQKEQKPEHFELKAGKWYICHRAFCCRADHLTVKEGERFMCEKDGVVKGFIIKEPEKYFIECSAPAPMGDEQKEQKPVVTLGETYHVDTLGTQQVIAGKMPQKPAEWSEEDEKIRGNLMSLLANMRGDRITEETYQKYYPWLKSLRPSWKPSEEQIYSLGTVVKGYDECTVGSVGYHLKEMYEQLKKLM